MSSSPEYSPSFLAQDKRSAVQSTCIAFLVFDTLAVALRIVSRRTNGVKWGWDDFFAILGYVLCVAVIASSLTDVYYGGVGLHAARVEQINPEMLVIWAKFVLVIPLLYLAAIVPPKLSIISLYLRIFISKPIRKICYTVVGLIVANWLAATIAGFLICVPLDHLWNPARSPNGHCFDTNAWFRWSSLMNIITDVVIIVLPIPTVWQMNASYRMKLGILITFLLGGMGLIASIVRFVGFFGTNADADPTWAAASLCIWTVVESSVYLITSCAPTYRPLGRFIWHKTGLSNVFTTKSQENSKTAPAMNGNVLVSYELSQTRNFIRLDKSKIRDDESEHGLVV